MKQWDPLSGMEKGAVGLVGFLANHMGVRNITAHSFHPQKNSIKQVLLKWVLTDKETDSEI